MKLSMVFGDKTQPQRLESLDYHIWVVRDFFSKSSNDSTAHTSFTLTNAEDKTRIFETFKPNQTLKIKNILRKNDSPLVITTAPLKFKDFSPRALIRANDDLYRVASLIEILSKEKPTPQTLKDLSHSHRDLLAVKDILNDAITNTSSNDETPLPSVPEKREIKSQPREGILAFVDMPGESVQRTQSAKSAIQHAMGSIAKKKANPATSQKDQLIENLKTLLAHQLDEIYHHPDFQALESTYRGLNILLNHIDFRSSTKLTLFHSPKSNIVDTLQRNIESHSRPSLIVLPFEIETSDDLKTTEALSEIAFQHSILILSSASFDLVKNNLAVNTSNSATTNELIEKWIEIRKKPSADWISLTFNRVLLREAYQGQTSPNNPWSYYETIRAERDYLWGDSSYLLAALIAKSVAETSWPTEIMGRIWRIENLAVRTIRRNSGRNVQSCQEIKQTHDEIIKCADLGFLALASADNSDRVEIVSAPLTSTKELAGRPALPYQLLAARLTEALHDLSQYASSLEKDQQSHYYEKKMLDIIYSSGIGAALSITSNHDSILELDIQMGRSILSGAQIGLSVPIA